MFSIVPVLDDLVSNAYQPSVFGRSLSLMDEFKNQLGSTNEVKTLEDNSKQLVLGINVETFKPEEIKVSIKENFLEISANHEEKTEHSFVKRQFSRRFLLPENAIQQKMNCSMNSSGVLKITIPKNPEKAVDKPVTIPIQFQK